MRRPISGGGRSAFLTETRTRSGGAMTALTGTLLERL
jgi:hypothetical protein